MTWSQRASRASKEIAGRARRVSKEATPPSVRLLERKRELDLESWELRASIAAEGERAAAARAQLDQSVQQQRTAVRQLDKLTIAAMEGFAIQTGFSLGLSLPLRVHTTIPVQNKLGIA